MWTEFAHFCSVTYIISVFFFVCFFYVFLGRCLHVAWCMDKERDLLQFGQLVYRKQTTTGENCLLKLFHSLKWFDSWLCPLETLTVTPAEDSVLVGCCAVLLGVHFLTPVRTAWYWRWSWYDSLKHWEPTCPVIQWHIPEGNGLDICHGNLKSGIDSF